MTAVPADLPPNSVAFRDVHHGALASGDTRGGAISLTGDGGRTWRVVLRTKRPVASVGARRRDLWAPLAGGIGPAGAYTASLDPARQEALRAELHRRLGAPAGCFELTARSWFVRGRR